LIQIGNSPNKMEQALLAFNTVKRVLRSFFCGVLGAVVGTAVGLAATFAIVKISVALSPNNPSAASAGDVGMLLIPGGLVAGACFGARRRPTT
jgi:hypothetical protein